DEACQILETNFGQRVDRAVLARIYGRFCQRARPRFVADEANADPAQALALADADIVVADAQRVVERTAAALREVLRATPAQDRLILRLHFFENVSIADVARRLDLDQKRLYRRLERLLERLRMALEEQGLFACDVLSAASHHGTSLDGVFPRDNVVAMLKGLQ